MRCAAAFALLLAACAAEFPPSEAQETATDIALEHWEARFGDAPACWSQRGDLQWQEMSREDVTAECERKAAATDLIACTYRTIDYVRIVVPDDDTGGEAAHELLHWLQACSGKGDPGNHAAPGVWHQRGQRDSLEDEIGDAIAAEWARGG
jgi:hypothetical protein